MLGIALPADHPVWTAAPHPLPVRTGDTLRALPAPGWLVSGTRADGIVRVVNHGTDHATEGSTGADSPLYARLGYSTATAPVLDESGWTAPLDQAVVLIDRDGQCSHRTGMRTLTTRIDGGAAPVGVAGSTTLAHWVRCGPGRRDHGAGRVGQSGPAGMITVFSLVRGPWEVRLTRVDNLDPGVVRLRVGGWPVAGAGTGTTCTGTATATAGGLTSRLTDVPVGGGTPDEITAGVTVLDDAGPLGGPVRVPWLARAPRTGAWTATLVELSAGDGPPGPPACRVALDAAAAQIDWPDGVRTRSHLGPPASGFVPGPTP
jgi:hypothetical protein